MGSRSSRTRDVTFAQCPATHPPARQPRRPHAAPAHRSTAPASASPPAYHQSDAAPSQYRVHIPEDAAFGKVFSLPDRQAPPTGAPRSRLFQCPPRTPVTQAIFRLSWSLPAQLASQNLYLTSPGGRLKGMNAALTYFHLLVTVPGDMESRDHLFVPSVRADLVYHIGPCIAYAGLLKYLSVKKKTIWEFRRGGSGVDVERGRLRRPFAGYGIARRVRQASPPTTSFTRTPTKRHRFSKGIIMMSSAATADERVFIGPGLNPLKRTITIVGVAILTVVTLLIALREG